MNSCVSISMVSGQRGNVRSLQLAKLVSDHVVMKCISNTPMPSAVLKEELQKMSSVKHENLNTFFGLCLDSVSVCTLMKYASRGSLYDLINLETAKLSTEVKQSLILDVALGMQYLHNSSIGKNIIHPISRLVNNSSFVLSNISKTILILFFLNNHTFYRVSWSSI